MLSVNQKTYTQKPIIRINTHREIEWKKNTKKKKKNARAVQCLLELQFKNQTHNIMNLFICFLSIHCLRFSLIYLCINLFMFIVKNHLFLNICNCKSFSFSLGRFWCDGGDSWRFVHYLPFRIVFGAIASVWSRWILNHFAR